MSPRALVMRPILWLLPFIPIAALGDWLHAPPVAIFALSALAILPLSTLLGDATEQLAGHAGPVVGGVINASLGNLAELIIAVLALRAGMVDLVKASITGSILGNLLLVLGAAQFAGGLKYPTQKFSRQLAGMNTSLLVIAVVGLVVPALFLAAHPDPSHRLTHKMSEFVAALLIVGYALSLLYSMGTHRAVFGEGGEVALGEAGAGVVDPHDDHGARRGERRARLDVGAARERHPGGGRGDGAVTSSSSASSSCRSSAMRPSTARR